ncbi:DUF4238 domain-containing protein [Roseovarius mucosus]|uniref:DUF4238 domain-containing protein n=1 Tax=Roseovarius mucosus TaxID=215743 RepID=UPI001C60559C|nr:DUF4238 domain-containing protein [Roseovarius mucosus]MBW4972853.1 DUF4238 domain-containing protein [Roseovarius mucosus]
MNRPKRHHWWPQLNSGFWCNADGNINVLNRDGTSFPGRPGGLGVVGHLYSKAFEDGEKDPAIETWFANEVDGPFAGVIDKFSDEKLIKRRPFRGDPDKAKTVKELGYRVLKNLEYFELSNSDRENISRYVAALLVRSPKYLSKLEKFHSASLNPKNDALDNMKYLYEVYLQRIKRADFVIIIRDAENEFLFSDGGIVAREPWSNAGGVPFDVHFPMTPDIALQVFPAMTQEFPNMVPVSRATNQGVSAHNRITLQHAENQVFGRGAIPIEFVMKNWGRPAPKHIGFRHVNGRLETKVDWSRHFH